MFNKNDKNLKKNKVKKLKDKDVENAAGGMGLITGLIVGEIVKEGIKFGAEEIRKRSK